MAEYVLHVNIANGDAEQFEAEIERSIDNEEFLVVRTDGRRFDMDVVSYGKE